MDEQKIREQKELRSACKAFFEKYQLSREHVVTISQVTGYNTNSVRNMLRGLISINDPVMDAAVDLILARKPGLRGDQGFQSSVGRIKSLAPKRIRRFENRGANESTMTDYDGAMPEDEWKEVEARFAAAAEAVATKTVEVPPPYEPPPEVEINAGMAFALTKRFITDGVFTDSQKADLLMELLRK